MFNGQKPSTIKVKLAAIFRDTHTSVCDVVYLDFNHVLFFKKDSADSCFKLLINFLFTFRTRSSHGSVFTIPGCLKVHAVCVESEELVRNTRVIGSDPTLGVNVEKINKFKVSHKVNVWAF